MPLDVTTPTTMLGDVELAGSGPFEWDLTFGATPYQRDVLVSRRTAEKITTGVPLTYKLSGGREFEQVYCLWVGPGDTEDTRTLRLSDRRWTWPSVPFTEKFNVRRFSGVLLELTPGENPENAIADPDIYYVRHSLFPPEAPAKPWSGRDLVSYVMRKLVGDEFELPRLLQTVEIQNLFMYFGGDVAVQVALSYFPTLDVYINRAGKAVIGDPLSADAEALYEQIKDRQQERGTRAEIVDLLGITPPKVRVYFPVDVEVRFDTPDEGNPSITTDTPVLLQMGQEPNVGEEVLGPDGKTRKVARGSLHRLNALFDAWGTGPGVGPNKGDARQLSVDILRKHIMNGGKYLEHEFSRDASGAPNAPWARRFRSAMSAYRRLFSIDTEFLQRLESVTHERATIINYATGTRAPSPVYTNWIRRPTWRGLVNSGSEPNIDHGWEVTGYNAALASCQEAPADVSPFGNVEGTFVFRPKQEDTDGYAGRTEFGTSATGVLPVQNLGDANRRASEILGRWDFVELSSSWQLATIMTCRPGTPNNEQRFYVVEVDGLTASAKLGRLAKGFAPIGGRGPIHHVLVMPEPAMTAKVVWTDGNAQQILDWIRGTPVPNEQGKKAPPPFPESGLTNKDLLKDLAVAAAARVYAGFVSGPQGRAVVDAALANDLEPVGALSRVSHSTNSGETTVGLEFTRLRQPADVWRFLNPASRRAILGVLGGA